MPAQHVLKLEENSLSSTSDYIHGPPTGSRAKNIQEQVNLFLAEINFDIFENVVPPKCSTLVILRHTNKEEDVTLYRTSTEKKRPSDWTNTVKNRTSNETSTVKNGLAKRNIRNSQLREALEVHEDILEILSSLVFNGGSSKYFGLPNV